MKQGTIDFELLFQAVPGPLLVVLPDDPEFTIVAASDVYLRAVNMRREDVVGKSLFDVFAREADPVNTATLHNVRASFQRILATRQPESMPVQQFDFPRGEREGEHFAKRYWSPVNSPVLSPDGAVQFIFHHAVEVTRRMLAEAERRESDENFRYTIELSPQVPWMADREGNVLDFSQKWLDMTGLTREEALGEGWLRVPHPHDRPRMEANWVHSVHTKEPYDVEHRIRLADGSYRWMRSRAFPRLDAAGDVVRWYGTTEDIDERRQAERRDALLMELDDAVRPLTDPHEITQAAAALLGEYLQVNRCAYADVEEDEDTCTVTGDYNRGVESMAGHYAIRQFGTEGLRLMRGGQPYVVMDSETDPRTADVVESYRRVNIRSVLCVPLLKAGRLVAAMAVHQTTPRGWLQDEVELVRQVAHRCWESIERSRITRELREQERRYRFLTESIPQMVWTATPEGMLDYVSSQGTRYFGVEPKALLGAGWLGWVHPEDQEHAAERWKHSVLTGENYETAFRLRRGSDGSWHWHLVRALPLVRAGGGISQWFGTCTDIEDQKAAEAELTRANRELEEFAYVASHDLQEPLRMVNIYTQLLLQRMGGEDATLNGYAAFVQQGVARMDGLIRDLLTFSRIVHNDELPVGTADLQAACGEALSVLSNRITESGAVITIQPLPAVRGDALQMAHVLENLLSNALKYSRKDVSPEIHISAEPDGEQWTISVRDNGIGFDQQYAGRIFGLFKRLHRDEYPGTGLGLAICQRIIERYGGRIWAESKPDAGATFRFSLPRAERL